MTASMLAASRSRRRLGVVLDLETVRLRNEAAVAALAAAPVRYLPAELLEALQGSWGAPEELGLAPRAGCASWRAEPPPSGAASSPVEQLGCVLEQQCMSPVDLVDDPLPAGCQVLHNCRFPLRKCSSSRSVTVLSLRSPLTWCTVSCRSNGRPSSCSMSTRCSSRERPSTVITR
jgi:hypothetical protein